MSLDLRFACRRVLAIVFVAFSNAGIPMTPVWTLALPDPLLQPHIRPDKTRSCDVERWDASHLLVYSLVSTRTLVSRTPSPPADGNWSFSVQVVRNDDGVVELSSLIPADSHESELAVVEGGIVVSEKDRLVFYTRDFRRADSTFAYVPINRPSLPFHSVRTDFERLYKADQGKIFVLEDTGNHLTHLFLFDGTTFEKRSDWTVAGAISVDVKGSRVSYGKLVNGDSISSQYSWTDFGPGDTGTTTSSGPSDEAICRTPISVDGLVELDACGSVRRIDRNGSAVLYQPGKGEIVDRRVRVSLDDRYAALLVYSYKGGGVLDLTERLAKAELIIVKLQGEMRVCKLPLVPMPQSQLRFTFSNDSKLVVLRDGIVSAYKDPCT